MTVIDEDVMEDLLGREAEEENVWEAVVDYDYPVGKCANCGNTIFQGEGGPTVHGYCESAFIYYLNHPEPLSPGLHWSDE